MGERYDSKEPYDPIPRPVRIAIGFGPHCRTCQPYFGYASAGFCRFHETYVNGLHACPDWELRQCEEYEEAEDVEEKPLDPARPLLNRRGRRARRRRGRR